MRLVAPLLLVVGAWRCRERLELVELLVYWGGLHAVAWVGSMVLVVFALWMPFALI